MSWFFARSSIGDMKGINSSLHRDVTIKVPKHICYSSYLPAGFYRGVAIYMC